MLLYKSLRHLGALVGFVIAFATPFDEQPGSACSAGSGTACGALSEPIFRDFSVSIELPTRTVNAGLYEVKGGIARFIVEDVPWADLQVETPRTSRRVRMMRVEGHNQYPIHGLYPGDVIQFRFLLGTESSPGQTWSDWLQHTYTGEKVAAATGRTPRMHALPNGKISFEVENVLWADIHIKINGALSSHRLGVNQELHSKSFYTLTAGDVVSYRWVIGIDEAPGQYETAWTNIVYSHAEEETSPPPQEESTSVIEPQITSENESSTESNSANNNDLNPTYEEFAENTSSADTDWTSTENTEVQFEPDSSVDLAEWNLVWSDEFGEAVGISPDSSRWEFDIGGDGWGNAEYQFYTDRTENVATDGDGNLVITARRENIPGSSCWYGGCQYSSARLLTSGRFEQKYGRIEIRARIPFGQGIWPAFWMLGSNIESVGWPDSGEIDIIENIGREPSSVHGTVHGPGYSAGEGISGAFSLPDGGRFSDEFHVFAIEWSPSEIRWFSNGEHYHTVTPTSLPFGAKWVFDQPFFLLLNVAVGGLWPGYPDTTTTFPQSMHVDYVRVYERKPTIDLPGDTSRNVTEKIEAENYDSQLGLLTEITSDLGGGQNVGWIANGDWALYSNVDFGAAGPNILSGRFASGSDVDGRIIVRLDSVDGPELASFDLQNTGGWQSWETQTTALARRPTGLHDLFVFFEGPHGSREFGNVNWLHFGATANGIGATDGPTVTSIGPTAPVGSDTTTEVTSTNEETVPNDDLSNESTDTSHSDIENPNLVSTTPEMDNPEHALTPERFQLTRKSLYLKGGARVNAPSLLSVEPGDGGSFDMLPADGSPLAWEIHDLYADYLAEQESTEIALWLDSVRTPGIYAQARILFDFDGDGVFDRIEGFVAAPSHDHVGLDSYNSDQFPMLESSGEYRDLEGGTVRIEIHDPHQLEGPEIRVGASPREHQVSKIKIPFALEVIEFEGRVKPRRETAFDESILCPKEGSDPRCGTAFNPERALSPDELVTTMSRGIESFRFRGQHGACASCHSPDGFDLAVVGYRDSDIRRRALEHVSEQRANEIVELIHAHRQKHDMQRLLHPGTFRPLQPGHAPLPGSLPVDRDLAFLHYLHDEVGLLLLTENIDSSNKAKAAENQLSQLDLRDIRIGIRLDRWSEDGFHGPSHQGQDLTDPTNALGHTESVAEWLPNMGVTPLEGGEEAYFSLFDTYSEDPTDANFWLFYDSIRKLTESEEALRGPEDQRAYEFMLSKYESVQIMSHMLRHRTRDFPDRLVDRYQHDEVSDVGIAIPRNPFWRVGDLIRQHPLNCNHPDGCTVFPDFVKAETDIWKQEVQSRLLQRAWFWAGWITDPALLSLDPSFETISGDYFYPLHHAAFRGHYAFIMAKMSTEKANAVGWEVSGGRATAGHGKWASIRPFLVWKHSEFHRPQVSENDPRHDLYTKLMTNVARMWLFMVDADLEATETAFDRPGTAKAMNFIRLNWLDSADPDGSREDTEALFHGIVDKLRTADELRQQHHTYDLYDYLPVADVDVD